MKHRDVYTYLDTVAPLAIQEDWDHAGFMLGSLDDETTGILVTLDLTRETLTAAIDIGANLIVTHHPVIFAPLASVDRETAKGDLIARALIAGITVLSWHTNFDKATGGVNDVLAEKLGLTDVQVLAEDAIGRVGTVSETTAETFANVVKRALGLPHVTLYGDPETFVRRVALVGGSGMDYIAAARESGADLFLTGDIRYHNAQDALDMGLVLIDATHDGTENPAMDALAETLRKEFSVPVHAKNPTFPRQIR